MKRHLQNVLWIAPLALLLLILVHPRYTLGSERVDDIVDALGLLLVVLGAWMRVCARGWKFEHGRRGLVTDGLYGYVRHPLYVASFLIGLGLCIIIGLPWFLLTYLVCFLIGHLPAIRREEAYLARRWPGPHAAYRRHVPLLFPTVEQLRRRRPICPRQLLGALRREADTVCGWTAAGLGLEIWEDVTVSPLQSHPLEVSVLAALIALLIVAWVWLKQPLRGVAARSD